MCLFQISVKQLKENEEQLNKKVSNIYQAVKTIHECQRILNI